MTQIEVLTQTLADMRSMHNALDDLVLDYDQIEDPDLRAFLEAQINTMTSTWARTMLYTQKKLDQLRKAEAK